MTTGGGGVVNLTGVDVTTKIVDHFTASSETCIVLFTETSSCEDGFNFFNELLMVVILVILA